MHASGVQHLLPIACVVAGVFLLVAPRIVSFAVAVYLIFVGLLCSSPSTAVSAGD